MQYTIFHIAPWKHKFVDSCSNQFNFHFLWIVRKSPNTQSCWYKLYSMLYSFQNLSRVNQEAWILSTEWNVYVERGRSIFCLKNIFFPTLGHEYILFCFLRVFRFCLSHFIYTAPATSFCESFKSSFIRWENLESGKEWLGQRYTPDKRLY